MKRTKRTTPPKKKQQQQTNKQTNKHWLMFINKPWACASDSSLHAAFPVPCWAEAKTLMLAYYTRPILFRLIQNLKMRWQCDQPTNLDILRCKVSRTDRQTGKVDLLDRNFTHFQTTQIGQFIRQFTGQSCYPVSYSHNGKTQCNFHLMIGPPSKLANHKFSPSEQLQAWFWMVVFSDIFL